jgi:hypothetical protein
MKNYESWVSSFVERLSDYFNLAGWTIRIKYKSEPDAEQNTYAEISVNSTYLFANLFIYPQGKKDFEAGETNQLIMALVHELCHIFVDPFHDWAGHHISETTAPAFVQILEQQTQKLTMVILKSLPPDIIPPRPKNGKHDSTPKND